MPKTVRAEPAETVTAVVAAADVRIKRNHNNSFFKHG